MTPPFRLRPAVSDDLASIVALHVASWRSAYRGIFSDRYLDGPIEAERQALWQARMRDPRPAQIVVVADDLDGGLVGFACGFIDEDPNWGSFVNNLHVSPNRKGGESAAPCCGTSAVASPRTRRSGPVICFASMPTTPPAAFTHPWAGKWSNA